MDQDQHDHAGTGVVVQRAQKPAERLLVIEIKQTLIGAIRRRHVYQCETDAGENLHGQQGDGSATEHVPPAHRPGRAPGNGMQQQRQQTLADAQPRVEPSKDATSSPTPSCCCSQNLATEITENTERKTENVNESERKLDFNLLLLIRLIFSLVLSVFSVLSVANFLLLSTCPANSDSAVPGFPVRRRARAIRTGRGRAAAVLRRARRFRNRRRHDKDT